MSLQENTGKTNKWFRDAMLRDTKDPKFCILSRGSAEIHPLDVPAHSATEDFSAPTWRHGGKRSRRRTNRRFFWSYALAPRISAIASLMLWDSMILILVWVLYAFHFLNCYTAGREINLDCIFFFVCFNSSVHRLHLGEKGVWSTLHTFQWRAWKEVSNAANTANLKTSKWIGMVS